MSCIDHYKTKSQLFVKRLWLNCHPPSIDVMLGVKIHVTILEKLDVSSKNLSMLVLEEELKVHLEL